MIIRQLKSYILRWAYSCELYQGEKMESSYDLTSVDGVRSAISRLKGNGIINTIYGPQLWLLDKVLGIFDSNKLCETQRKMAEELIKSGRENGVDKMTITMEQQAGVNFEVPIEGVKIKAMAGNKGKMVIQVEYSKL